MYKKYLVLFFVLIGLSLSVNTKAQMENTLFHLHAVPQSSHVNPGKFLDYNVSITLPVPSINMFATNSGFSLNDAFRFENKKAIIQPAGISKALIDNNVISVGGNITFFGIYIRGEKTAFNFHVEEHMEARFNYPREFVDFIVKGNGHPDFLDKTVVLNPTFNFLHYREFTLGITRKINEKLDLGANFRLLFGLGSIDTENVRIELFTSNEANYPLTVKASGDVSMAGVPLFFDDRYDGIDEAKYPLQTKNAGFAIDLGASYALNEKLMLEASLLNLGKIGWKNYTTKLDITENTSTFTFEGIDVLGTFREDEDENFDPFQNTIDSLKEAFDIDKIWDSRVSGNYSTGLPVQLNFGARYELSNNLYLNGHLNARFYKDEFVPTLSTSVLKEFGRAVSLALSYTTAKNSINNLGFGFSLNTPFQFHVVSDNIITLALFPKSAKNFNIRTGVNLVFGHHEHRKNKKNADPVLDGEIKDELKPKKEKKKKPKNRKKNEGEDPENG